MSKLEDITLKPISHQYFIKANRLLFFGVNAENGIVIPVCLELWFFVCEWCSKDNKEGVYIGINAMERQINIYSNIYTYLQIFGPRYKSFIPIFKSFVPSFKSFIPKYKWFADMYKWFVPTFKWFIPIFKYDCLYLGTNELYLGTNHLYLSSNTVDMATFTISLWTEANWT